MQTYASRKETIPRCTRGIIMSQADRFFFVFLWYVGEQVLPWFGNRKQTVLGDTKKTRNNNGPQPVVNSEAKMLPLFRTRTDQEKCCRKMRETNGKRDGITGLQGESLTRKLIVKAK